jgi:hypothetical protein
MIRDRSDCAMSHNVHCVKNTTAHYIWGEAPQEETLLDKVCAGAAFIGCIVVLMFLG